MGLLFLFFLKRLMIHLVSGDTLVSSGVGASVTSVCASAGAGASASAGVTSASGA